MLLPTHLTDGGGFGDWTFYHYALLATAVCLLVAVLLSLYVIYTQPPGSSSVLEAGKAFPPLAEPCPNQWKVNTDGKCSLALPAASTTLPPNYARLNLGDYVQITDQGTKSAVDYDKLSNAGAIAPTFTVVKATASDAGSVTFDPKDPAFSKDMPLMGGQRRWARAANIEWEGVSNYRVADANR